jgi:hypothetical protein
MLAVQCVHRGSSKAGDWPIQISSNSSAITPAGDAYGGEAVVLK